MKAKKEYLILAIIIIAAGLYLVFHKKDQTQYTLPEIPRIEIDTVTRLEIKTPEETIALNKKEARWLIAPQNYPADGAKIKSMLFALEEIVLTDLVSESKAYVRYQLDDSSKITVKAWAGEELVRDFAIGKEAATYQHTFMRLPSDPNVYHAQGDFRRKFEENATDLRDHEVLAFDPDTLTKIRLTSGPDTLALTRSQAQPAGEKAASGDQQDDTSATAAKPAWIADDGNAVDAATLENFLTSINNLQCDAYLEDRQKESFQDPVFGIVLEGKLPYTLSVFKKENEKDTAYPAVSSFNAYPFTLNDDRLANWKEAVAKLAGKAEKTKTD
jgi:hypothetical protein